MFRFRSGRCRDLRSPFPKCLIWLLLILLLGVTKVISASAQDTSQQAPANPNKQEAPPAAGGPQNDVGPYVIPKKKEEPPPPAPEKPKKIENMPDYSIRVEVPEVDLDVLVTTKDGQTVPGLRKDNFKIFEDGAPQAIATFNQTQAPITAVLLVEFATTNYSFIIESIRASYAFANTLQKNDWVSVISYDMKPRILIDFTQDKREVQAALNQLRPEFTGFSETNLFDATFDTLDRLERIEGKKYIILVTTGVDTFSKINLDQILKKIKSTKDVTIYPISVGFAAREYCEVHHCRTRGIIPVGNMDYLQADNEMRTFASLTGGRAYFPRFQGELPEIFNQVGSDIRNQYSITYHPTNAKLDGTYRKLKVELKAPDGSALKVRDQKGKDVKVVVYAREGYTAKHTVE